MKIKFLTTASDPTNAGWLQLKRSLEHFCWDFVLVQHSWLGFGSKLAATRAYLPTLLEQGYTHVLYGDSYDSFILSDEKELREKITNEDVIIYAGERASYPIGDFAKLYPPSHHDWKHPNGGGIFFKIERFIEMWDRNPCPNEMNDQLWSTVQLLFNNHHGVISVEHEPQIFQTLAFENSADFSYGNGRLINNVLKSKPILLHGNAKVPMKHIYELI